MVNKKVDPKVIPTREALRGKLLGSAPKPMRKAITLFGQELEIRQPTLGSILAAQQVADLKERSVGMIIDYCYVPGTDEKVFEPTDKDVMLNWPFSDELLNLQVAIGEMTGIDITKAEETLEKDPLEGQS